MLQWWSNKIFVALPNGTPFYLGKNGLNTGPCSIYQKGRNGFETVAQIVPSAVILALPLEKSWVRACIALKR